MSDSKSNNEAYLKKYNETKESTGILTSDDKVKCKDDAGGDGAKKADPKYGCC